MKKTFNITGSCIPDRHYMSGMSDKLDRIMEMIVGGDYFTIDRPRQYGKTTILYLLEQRLIKDSNYLVLNLSFEGISSPTYENHQRFIHVMLGRMHRALKFLKENELAGIIEKNQPVINDMEEFDSFITGMVLESQRKIVIMIDEVDKAGNNQLFLDFLGMLREKYLRRNQGKDHTFHSVILAGVHDIKTLKTKIRHGREKRLNSPWNIAVDFDIDLSLFPEEIASMLTDYARDRNITMDIPFFSRELFYFTSGYPFLVCYLCKIIDEKILPQKNKKEWEPHDLVKAVQVSLSKSNTNFDSLIKNLENEPALYDFVFQVIMKEEEFSYNRDNPVINLGSLYGILRGENEKTRIHNRLYEQRIYNYMASRMETSGEVKFQHVSTSYFDKDGVLNIEKIIRKFQEFMKEKASAKDTDFLERNGRLLFLAFIRPIINGIGFDFKEAQISEEKRLDVVITFQDRKHIIELKIWRGESYHQEGVLQLCDYLDRENQNRGYLVIFDLRKQSARVGEWEKIEARGKEIFAAWV